ncbi:MAG: trypsin-like peptidase domain-containing protein [Myxococcota bacterium]
MRSLVLAAVFTLIPLSVDARSSSLWTERQDNTPPLAQVPDFKTLAKRSMGAVVGIQVEQRARTSDGSEEFFERFWGGPSPREFRNRGLGSGFLIREDGLVLTNNHVVENASAIEVSFQLNDGSEQKMEAKILGTAPDYDVALIKTNRRPKVDVLPLGDSTEIDIGDWVMAIGNPFGLDHSVSVGIISAKGRRDIMPSGRRGLYDFIQTDAAINPGNSGGPLINMKGEVIGINTAINAAGTGIGFAIPVNMVKAMLPELKEKGRFAKSWIGIKIQPLDDALASGYGLKRPNGALVSEVVQGGPGAAAGLKEGDIVLEFDGKPIRESSDLPLYASMAGIGKKVATTVWRNNKRLKLGITLAAYPEDDAVLASSRPAKNRGKLGVTINDITSDLRREFSLEERKGVVVTDVERNSAADDAGLRPGDVILAVNGKNIGKARQFADLVKDAGGNSFLRVQISRGGGRMFVALRKPR